MRIPIQNYSNCISRSVIETLCNCATPRQWSSYTVSLTVMKMFSSQEPKSILSDLKSNIYVKRTKCRKDQLFDKSRLKIGQQCIYTIALVQYFLVSILIRSNQIRVGLKKSFFPKFN